jgi:hypothetical protein
MQREMGEETGSGQPEDMGDYVRTKYDSWVYQSMMDFTRRVCQENEEGGEEWSLPAQATRMGCVRWYCGTVRQ